MATPLLAVLVCSVPSRKHLLKELLAHLESQDPRDGSIAILVDSRIDPRIGEKRQSMLHKAEAIGAEYVAFIDDDDWVSDNYLQRIVATLRQHPGVDCLSLNGVFLAQWRMENGHETADWSRPFVHSRAFDAWENREDKFIRCPNHLNVVRTALAVAAGFPEGKSWGEDHDYSTRLRPLLRTEADLPDATYFYRANSATSAAGARRKRDGQ